MSESGKTKAEMIDAAARERAQSYDDHARELVEKWLQQIREISAEQDAPLRS